MNKVSGIYCIENIVNNKKYIGRSVNIYERWGTHKSNLRSDNKQENDYFQKSWNKYGENNFSFYIIELCKEEELSRLEIYWITMLKTKNRSFGYNMTDGGEGTIGFKHSDETKLKFKRKRPPFFGEAVSKAKKGKPSKRKGLKMTEEAKQKMRKPKSIESRKNMKLSEERKNKISERMKGEGNPNYGKFFTEEEKQKMSLTIVGRKKSKISSSKYVGVDYVKKIGKWRARIKVNRKEINLGRFDTENEAALAYNRASLKYFGENARINILLDIDKEDKNDR